MMGKHALGGGGGLNPGFMQAQRSSFQAAGGGRSNKFSTVLSSDGIDPEEYCALAYQDSEVEN